MSLADPHGHALVTNLLPCLLLYLLLYLGDQRLDLRQDALDDGIDTRGGGMHSIALIEPGLGSDAVEEEGVQQKAVLRRKIGVDRLEGAAVVGAEIGRGAHA